MFEEFLFTWQERLRKQEQPTAMSVKLQAEVDKYKVDSVVTGIISHGFLFTFIMFILHTQQEDSGLRLDGNNNLFEPYFQLDLDLFK